MSGAVAVDIHLADIVKENSCFANWGRAIDESFHHGAVSTLQLSKVEATMGGLQKEKIRRIFGTSVILTICF